VNDSIIRITPEPTQWAAAYEAGSRLPSLSPATQQQPKRPKFPCTNSQACSLLLLTWE
jgi:hypothetical protein